MHKQYGDTFNVKSTDHLHVDVIIQNHLPVDATSEQFSGISILQKILILLLSHLNRSSNTWVEVAFFNLTPSI